MGKIILLFAIGFALYWGIKFRNSSNKKEESDNKPTQTVDELIKEVESRIRKIESKSDEEIQKAQLILNHYKTELEKLNKLKKK